MVTAYYSVTVCAEKHNPLADIRVSFYIECEVLVSLSLSIINDGPSNDERIRLQD